MVHNLSRQGIMLKTAQFFSISNAAICVLELAVFNHVLLFQDPSFTSGLLPLSSNYSAWQHRQKVGCSGASPKSHNHREPHFLASSALPLLSSCQLKHLSPCGLVP